MTEVREQSGRVVRQAPMVWRSSLRGVLILDEELRLLEGLAATIWIALADGPLGDAGLVKALEGWGLVVEAEVVRTAVDQLLGHGLLLRS